MFSNGLYASGSGRSSLLFRRYPYDSQQCYDRTVQVLQRLQAFNVKSNLTKCKWFAPCVEYLGHVISKDGRKPSPEKIQASINFKVPENISQVRSFRGLLTHYINYLPNLSTLDKPLRRLLETNTKFVWDQHCQSAFDACKKLIVSCGLLIHYDPSL